MISAENNIMNGKNDVISAKHNITIGTNDIKVADTTERVVCMSNMR